MDTGVLSPASLAAWGSFQYAEGKEAPSNAAQRISAAFLRSWEVRDRTLPCSAASTEQGDGVFVLLDLGRETAGFFEMEIETAQPCLVDVGYGEHLEDLRVRTVIQDRHFAFSYYARQGRQRFLYPIKRIAGRYLQLHIHAGGFVLYAAGIRPDTYP